MSIAQRRQAVHREVFQLFLIKPSHYDADGYVIQWAKTDLPSNSLAVLYALAERLPRAAPCSAMRSRSRSP